MTKVCIQIPALDKLALSPSVAITLLKRKLRAPVIELAGVDPHLGFDGGELLSEDKSAPDQHGHSEAHRRDALVESLNEWKGTKWHGFLLATMAAYARPPFWHGTSPLPM